MEGPWGQPSKNAPDHRFGKNFERKFDGRKVNAKKKETYQDHSKTC